MYELTILTAGLEDSLQILFEQIINEEEKKLKLLATAPDCQKLIYQLEVLHPDIVVINADEPRWNIVNIMSDTREQHMGCEFILMGREKNFDKVYQALRLHACDYLFPPYSSEDIRKALHTATSCIRKRNHILPPENNAASRHLFMKKDIGLLKTNPKTMAVINETYGTYFSSGLFRALIIKLDCPSNIMSIFENDILRNKIIHITKDCLSEYCYDMLFDKLADGVLILMNYAEQYKKTMNREIESLFVEIRHIFQSHHGVIVTLCISREYLDFLKLPEIKFEVLDARWSRMDIGTNRMIFSQDMVTDHEVTAEQKKQLQSLSNHIIHSYEILDKEKSQHYLNEFFNYSHDLLSTREARMFIRNLIDILFNMYSDMIYLYTDADSLKHEFIYRVNMAPSFHRLKQTFISSIVDVLMHVSEMVEKQYSKPIQDSVIYIGKHYQKPIPLPEISRLA